MPELHDAFLASSQRFRKLLPEPEAEPAKAFVKRRIWMRWREAEMHGHFVDELKTLAGKTGSQLQKPEDQWPVLLCVLPPDRQAVTRELSAELIGEEGSELVEQSIGELAREHKAVALALICPSWLQWESTAGEVRNDGYREVLILQAIRADTVARYVAQILRSPDKAPVLGNWEKISEEMNIEHRRTDAAGPITQTKQT